MGNLHASKANHFSFYSLPLTCPPPTGESRSGACISPTCWRTWKGNIDTTTSLPRQEMTLVLTACGCHHMAPAVMLGNTSDCHVMRCSTHCWGHIAGRAAHSPYLLLNRICTHSRRVLMSSVSFMKASHFSIKTQGVQVRAWHRCGQPPVPRCPVDTPSWSYVPETATLLSQPRGLGVPLQNPREEPWPFHPSPPWTLIP